MTSLTIKTIQTTNDLQAFEDDVNAFGKEHNVKATQTHVTTWNGMMLYTAVIFYQE